MPGSQVVILLVALGGAREPSTRAMATAAQESLDPSALVLVREVPDGTLTSDARAIIVADAVHADAVAVLTWPDADHHRAHVHVYAARPARWVDRDIEFRGVDAAEERGKALGYAVAAMVPLRHEEPVNAPSPPPPPQARPRSTAAPALPPASLPAPSPPRDRRLALQLSAVGSTGIGGDADGFGSEGAFRWRFLGSLSFRIGGGLRIGDIPAASASSLLARFDAGFGWEAVTIGTRAPVTLGARADFVVLDQSLSRSARATGASRGSRWLPAGDLLLEIAWRFVSEAALVAAGGVEVAGGATQVLLDNEVAGVIPRVRILGEYGVRVLF